MVPCFQAIYEQLPKQRALPEAIKGEVRQLMQLQANKLLKQKIQQDTNKLILLKGLRNLASSLKPAITNDLKQTVQFLQKDYGTASYASPLARYNLVGSYLNLTFVSFLVFNCMQVLTVMP